LTFSTNNCLEQNLKTRMSSLD